MLQNIILAGLAQRERLFGHRCAWNGKSYLCSKGESSSEKTLSEGGMRVQAEMTVVLRAALFGTGAMPSENQRVTVDGINYKVEFKRSFDGYITLALNQDRRKV